MSFARIIHKVKLSGIDTSNGTSLLDIVNDHVAGQKDEHGNEIKAIECQCRGGYCGMCKVKVVDGEFEMNEDAFKELCMDDNETLACSTKIKSSTIEIEYGF